MKKKKETTRAFQKHLFILPLLSVLFMGYSGKKQVTKEQNGEHNYVVGEGKKIKNDEGSIAFGWLLSGEIVSWSAPDAKDFLMSRCWQGLYLYPTKSFSDEELAGEGEYVGSTFGGPCQVHSMLDWNRDGVEDIISTDRNGFMKLIERKGEYPNIEFIDHGYIKDKNTNLPFHIEYNNQQLGRLSSEGGYIDPQFYNAVYPKQYFGSESKYKDLIIGDWGGNIWWMPDVSDGTGNAEYTGEVYEKNVDEIVTGYAKNYIKNMGAKYVRPTERICDVDGNPIILGKGYNAGKYYEGSTARIEMYWNPESKLHDIIAIHGIKEIRISYLRCVEIGKDRKPVFENMGEVKVLGLGEKGLDGLIPFLNFHSKLMVDGKNREVYLSSFTYILKFKNIAPKGEKPVLEFDRYISGKNSITGGYNFTAMFTSKKGQKYFIDALGAKYFLRRIVETKPEFIISGEKIPVRTKENVIFIKAETDSEADESWGYDRIHKWDYNGKNGNSFILGSDKGNLYLLEEDLSVDEKDPVFTIKGPLKDETGAVIKIYNRAVAVGLNITNSKGEDLFVGGASYQVGITLQEHPGAGLYIIKNKGVDKNGAPILSAPEPANIEGITEPPLLNSNVMLQSYDIDRDGKREIFLGIRRDGYKTRIIEKKDGKLSYTGKDFPIRLTNHYLHDVDGTTSLFKGGGENGISYVYEVSKVQEE